MPAKRVAEIYISIGYNKHGKTELYRDLLRHLLHSDDRFEIARGEKGMVMVVFTMPSYDVVFKVIRDRFGDPKTSSRLEVMDRYQLVFKHDRAGRLVDAQEFEHLKFDRGRFSDELIRDLLATAGSSVTVGRDYVSIRHLYTERRTIPLDVYVREAGEDLVREAVLDYGQAIKDLAATNIFPGDILLKNFGVTRHGRVVFYDYDELTLLTECKFRRMPQGRDYLDELEAEPWFFVGKNDIFPEEFKTFLGLQRPYREDFYQAHADLFGVGFWKEMQKRHKAGEVIDIFPYRQGKRLHRQF
jgi:isocitrate dehydrogenase kinase/phosphatase